jgi:hypothetical protein
VSVQVALDQERPRLEQLGVEPDRLATLHDGFGPVPRLCAGLGQLQVIIRAPLVDRDHFPQHGLREVRSLEASQHAAAGPEGNLAAGFNAQQPFEHPQRLFVATQDPQSLPERFAGEQVVRPVADSSLEQGDGLGRGDPRERGGGCHEQGAQPQGYTPVAR